MEFDLEKFLDSDNPVCREERQYALFLYNCIDKAKACGEIKNNELLKLFDDAGKNIRIKGVYYEVTFMRDFFWADREAKDNTFNEKLYEFLYGKSCSKKISNSNKSRHVNKWILSEGETQPYLMRFMMNAKPDIAVWYSAEKDNVEQDYLSFFECKYESYEDKYNYCEGDDSKTVYQTTIQMLILMFLCGYNKNKREEIFNGIKEISDIGEHLDIKNKEWDGILSTTQQPIKIGCVKLVKFIKHENEEADDNNNDRIQGVSVKIGTLIKEGRGING